MPEYKIGGQTVKRKNLYRPCVLDEEFENADAADIARLLKLTSWCDNITSAEWPVVLEEDAATAPNRSRLKKKAAGWLMALARIAVLNPELFAAAAAQARSMYVEQIKDEYPWDQVALAVAGLKRPDEAHAVHLKIVPTYDEVTDSVQPAAAEDSESYPEPRLAYEIIHTPSEPEDADTAEGDGS